MANDLNVVALVGRLTRDAELRYAQSGSAILHFSIAVNRRKRTGDNQWEDEANFFDCAMFGKSVQTVSQYLVKGKQVSIVGELRQNRWEADGQTRSKVEIVVNSLSLLGSSQGGTGGGSYVPRTGSMNASPRPNTGYAQQPQAPAASPAASAAPSTMASSQPATPEQMGPEQFDDDDIPF